MGGGAGCVAGRAGRRWARRGAGDEGEIYADLVAGLGEAIVSGMVPGTSLSFTARKDALDSPQAPPRPARLHGRRAGLCKSNHGHTMHRRGKLCSHRR